MIKKELFKQLIVDFQERNLSDVRDRDYEITCSSNKIISLIGVRRSGKTYILFSLIKQLRQTIDTNNLLYINFEDDRLFPLTANDLSLFLESYYELYPAKKKEKVYFFFDEIQNVPAWELFLRRLADTENCAIYVTGSSAKLLSKEIATSLRGRTISYEIFPLSFSEFLSFKDIEPNIHSSNSRACIGNALNEYIWKGGFPEVVSQEKAVFFKILQEYLELIMYRDVLDRHHLSNAFLLKFLQKYGITHLSTLVSVNNLHSLFKQEGLAVSKNTLHDYLDYFEDAFLFFSIPIHSRSVKAELRNPKKIYCIDTGFNTVVDMTSDFSIGRIIENIVFLHLRRKYSQISYVKLKQETDFCYTAEKMKCLVNVSYNLENPSTKKRELTGLAEAMDYYKVKNGTIITSDLEETISLEERQIKIVPLWKWLLSKDLKL